MRPGSVLAMHTGCGESQRRIALSSWILSRCNFFCEIHVAWRTTTEVFVSVTSLYASIRTSREQQLVTNSMAHDENRSPEKPPLDWRSSDQAREQAQKYLP
jgi:hypothetical protein